MCEEGVDNKVSGLGLGLNRCRWLPKALLCVRHGHEQLMCLRPGPRVTTLHGLDPKPLREMKPLQRRKQEINCGIIKKKKKHIRCLTLIPGTELQKSLEFFEGQEYLCYANQVTDDGQGH